MKRSVPTLFLTIFVSLLIVTLPIESALAVSGILSASVTGKANVQNAVARSDKVTVRAEVAIDGDTQITPDQIWFNANRFDTCIPSGNSAVCTYSFPKAGDTTWPDRSAYSIGLYNDNHIGGIEGQQRPSAQYLVGPQVLSVLVVDDSKPELALSLDRTRSGTIITATARVQEIPYEECSGIKTIQFTSSAGEQIFDFPKGRCFAEQQATIDVSKLAERDYQLTVKISDYLGNSVTKTAAYTVDKTAGDFRDVKIYSGDVELKQVGSSPIDIRVFAKAGTDVLSASADLSKLTKNAADMDLPGDCQMQSDGLYCDWRVTLSPDAYGSVPLIFKARDDSGNAGQVTVTKILDRDIDGPLALKLSTNISAIAPYYIKKSDNIIRVAFSESGSGLDKTQVKLDLSTLHGPSALEATRCDPSWECVWEHLNFEMPDGTYAVKVAPSTMDRLGNTLRQEFTENVVLDTEAPRIINVQVKALGGDEFFPGYAIRGNSLEITANLTDASQIAEAYGDFSKFIVGANFVTTDNCEYKAPYWVCTWNTDAIDKEGFIQDKVTLNFVDSLGNKQTIQKEVTAYGVDTQGRELWSSSVECSPAKIDRQVASLIGQKVVCHVKLTGSAELLDVKLGECSGNGTAHIEKTELFNAKSVDPYLRFTLLPVEIKEKKWQLGCSLLLSSKTGNTIVLTPETEPVAISVPVYKSPLGEYGKNVEAKVEQAKADASGALWETISTLRELIMYAEKLCSLIRTLNNIAGLWNTLGTSYRSAAQLLNGIPGGQAAAATAEIKGQADQTIAEVVNQNIKRSFFGLGEVDAINKFCKFVSCDMFLDDAGISEDIGKYQKEALNAFNTVATGGFETGRDANGRPTTAGGTFGLGGKGVNAYSYPSNQGGVVEQVAIEGGKLNPKDSLIVSMVTICIPGIVHNLDKYRQIQCMYADCLQTSADAGIPMYACEDSKAYGMCKYVYGEVFQLLPFTGLLNYFIGLVKNILYNPLAVLDILVGYQCMQPIHTPGMEQVANLCLVKETIGIFESVISDLSDIGEGWELETDYCARLDTEEEDD